MKNSTFEFVASTFLVLAFIAICVLACALAFLAGYALGRDVIWPALGDTILPLLAGAPWW